MSQHPLPSRAAMFGLLAFLAGCDKPQPPAPPPTEVAVLALEPRSIQEQYEFVGDVEASRSVQVRSQVTGVILSRPFTEGAQVKAGAILYRIDPRTYEAEWRSAKARLADAEARLANAEQNVGRLRPLLADNAVARRDVDDAEAQLKQAQAAVENARADLDRARKDLDETTVRAEIGGRVGRANLEVGDRVTGPGDLLTTIDVLDPVYVNFRPSAQQLLRWQRDPAVRRRVAAGGDLRVVATLPDGGEVPKAGRISFVDPVVDPQTGTQQFRAEFRNADRLLLPGQFVRVRLVGLQREGALVVPQRAVLQQLGRQVVYVVGKGDTVATRDVQATSWSGGEWVIERGLDAGDRVVVDGLQKIGPGAVVRPVPLATSATAQADPAAETTP